MWISGTATTATFESVPCQMTGRMMTVQPPSQAHRPHWADWQCSSSMASSIFQPRGLPSGIRELSPGLTLVQGTIDRLPVGSGTSSR